MQLEEIQNTLTDIQNSTFEHKILDLIYKLCQEQNSIKDALAEMQNRLNDTIIEVNAILEEKEDMNMKENNNELS